MKDPMTRATKRQRNYALRRVVYDTLIAAKALYVGRSSGRDFSAKEAAKVAGLIMARNLDDFFFMQTRKAARKGKAKPHDAYHYDDDIFVCNFGLTWAPATNAMLSDADRRDGFHVGKTLAQVSCRNLLRK